MSSPSNEEPLSTTDLAVERSRMAAERTLMAWIRTSLSMISFGFTIYKFFQYMKDSEKLQDWQPRGALNMGTALVVLGTLLLIPATWQHSLFIRRLKAQAKERFPVSMAQIASGLIALLGLAALANLVFKLGPF